MTRTVKNVDLGIIEMKYKNATEWNVFMQNVYKQIADKLIAWYPEHARDLPWRKDKEPYHVWLSEIMLQQTRVEAVKEYYRRFLQEIPTIEALAEVDDDRLMKLWEGLGYYNRARNLKKAAGEVVIEWQGKFPAEYDEILSLPGIGEYTAGAIGAICFDLPTPAVDGNVLRVYTRVMENPSNIDKQAVKKKIREELLQVYQYGHCDMLTQSLMEVGATICLPNGAPKCTVCPLQKLCKAHEHDSWQQYPVREAKKKRKIEEKAVLMLRYEDKVAIRKRTEKGLLHGLWEFPNLPGGYSTQDILSYVTSKNLHPKEIWMETTYTHIFSHVEWHMKAYYMECMEQQMDDLRWVTLEELKQKIAIPSAFAPFKELLYSGV